MVAPRKASHSTQVSVPEHSSSSTGEHSPVPHGSCGDSSEGEEAILQNYTKIWEAIPSAAPCHASREMTPLSGDSVIPLNLSECLSLDQCLAKPRLVLQNLNPIAANASRNPENALDAKTQERP